MAQTVETSVPDEDRQELLRGSVEATAAVRALVISDGATLEQVAAYRLGAKTRLELIAERVGGRVKAVYDAWRGLRDMQNELERPWLAIVDSCTERIAAWHLAERRRAQEEDRRAAAARQEAQLAAARQHAQQLEAARQEAERKRAEEAAALLEAGDTEGASAALGAPLRPATVLTPLPSLLPPAAAPSRAERPKGLAVPVKHKARLVNLDQLIVAAAADPLLRSLLMLNQAAADGMAKAMGARMAVPGLEVYEDATVRQRR